MLEQLKIKHVVIVTYYILFPSAIAYHQFYKLFLIMDIGNSRLFQILLKSNHIIKIDIFLS
uniref:Uncharacterized protein n=1 Tax=Oryza brachyantha TaxID=4533 RepID=J3LI64_ORYBR